MMWITSLLLTSGWENLGIALAAGLIVALVSAYLQRRQEEKRQRWPFEKYDSFAELLERPDLKAEIPHALRTTVDLPEDPPPALLITGPAGVGKSREALEWLRRLEAQSETGQVQFLVPRFLGRYQHPENLEIPGDLRARHVVILLDSLENYSHEEAASMEAFGEACEALERHLPHSKVSLLATLRKRDRAQLAAMSPWDAASAKECELSWLQAEESATLIRKCVEHYELPIEETFAEALGQVADGQAVSLVGFFREQQTSQATPLGEDAINQYVDTWKGKKLKPLLKNLSLDAKKVLAALGYLIEQSLPPTPMLHTAVYRSFYQPSLGGRLRAFFSRRRGRKELRATGLLEDSPEALSPYHDLLSETSYLELVEAGVLPTLHAAERWLGLAEDLTRRSSVWLAGGWSSRRRTYLTSLTAFADQTAAARNVHNQDEIRLHSSIRHLAKRASDTQTEATALGLWGLALQDLAQATFATQPDDARDLYRSPFGLPPEPPSPPPAPTTGPGNV